MILVAVMLLMALVRPGLGIATWQIDDVLNVTVAPRCGRAVLFRPPTCAAADRACFALEAAMAQVEQHFGPEHASMVEFGRVVLHSDDEYRRLRQLGSDGHDVPMVEGLPWTTLRFAETVQDDAVVVSRLSRPATEDWAGHLATAIRDRCLWKEAELRRAAGFGSLAEASISIAEAVALVDEHEMLPAWPGISATSTNGGQDDSKKSSEGDETRDADGNTALHLAVASGDADRVMRLLANGASPHARDARRATPLHLVITAVAKERLRSTYSEVAADAKRIAEALLEHGADPNAQDLAGNTPCHEHAGLDLGPPYHQDGVVWEYDNAHTAVLEALGKSGANCEARNAFGQTPLHLAVVQNNYEAVEWLCADDGGSVRVAAIDIAGNTPLHYALDQIGLAVRVLLRDVAVSGGRAADASGIVDESLADYRVKRRRRTRLLVAGPQRRRLTMALGLASGNESVVARTTLGEALDQIDADGVLREPIEEMLLACGALVLAAKAEDETDDADADTMLRMLRRAAHAPPPSSCRLEQSGSMGLTPLALATLWRQHDAARVLLQAGALPEGRGAAGLSAVDVAAASSNERLVKLLGTFGGETSSLRPPQWYDSELADDSLLDRLETASSPSVEVLEGSFAVATPELAAELLRSIVGNTSTRCASILAPANQLLVPTMAPVAGRRAANRESHVTIGSSPFAEVLGQWRAVLPRHALEEYAQRPGAGAVASQLLLATMAPPAEAPARAAWSGRPIKALAHAIAESTTHEFPSLVEDWDHVSAPLVGSSTAAVRSRSIEGPALSGFGMRISGNDTLTIESGMAKVWLAPLAAATWSAAQGARWWSHERRHGPRLACELQAGEGVHVPRGWSLALVWLESGSATLESSVLVPAIERRARELAASSDAAVGAFGDPLDVIDDMAPLVAGLATVSPV